MCKCNRWTSVGSGPSPRFADQDRPNAQRDALAEASREGAHVVRQGGTLVNLGDDVIHDAVRLGRLRIQLWRRARAESRAHSEGHGANLGSAGARIWAVLT